MTTATITKVGNSMAVILPKALRQAAALDDSSSVRLESPRKGVVVITAIEPLDCSRLERFRAVEKRLKDDAASLPPWPEGLTADDLIRQGKKGRADELLPL